MLMFSLSVFKVVYLVIGLSTSREAKLLEKKPNIENRNIKYLYQYYVLLYGVRSMSDSIDEY